MIFLDVNFNYLDIGIKLRNMKKQLFCIFFHALDKYLPPISRDPDEMIFGLIDGMRTLSEFHANILSDSISSG